MFYIDLFQALNVHGVKYAVIGGLAMNLHGIPRLTMDVDLLISFDPENIARFEKTCGRLGLAPALPIRIADLADPAIREAWRNQKHMKAFSLNSKQLHAPTLDIVIDPAAEADLVISTAEEILVQCVGVPVANPRELLRLKTLSGREQDRADLVHLKRLIEGCDRG